MLHKLLSTVWELLKFILITLIIVVPIRTFIAQPFIVSGLSMYPTFHDHDYLIIDELSYYLREPKRGEVIVFHYPKDTTKYFIKRVIGLPGETVTVRNNEVHVTNTAGQQVKLDESHANGMSAGNVETKLGAGEYFVMGDNREVSLDSRVWGVLPRNLITGRAFLRLYPFSPEVVLPGAVATNN
jgi:signal peptidase I